MPVPARPAALLAALVPLLLAGCAVSVGTPGSSSPTPSGPSSASDAPPQSASPAPTPSIDVPTPSVPVPSVPGVPSTGAPAPSSGTGGPGLPRAGASGLAPGFPVPAGSRVTVTRDDTSGETAGGIAVPSATAAFSFFRTQLPARGYRVVSADGDGGLGEIRFSGHGCGGDSQLAFTGGRTVRYQCDAG